MKQVKTSHIACFAAASLLLSLTGCMSVPEFHVGTERVDGAFVSTDGKLYLLGTTRSAVFDAAPFGAYRALMDSPLKDAVACARLNYRIDVKGSAAAETVHGTYGMLLHADRVAPEQAARFGLQRLEVAALDDPARVPDRYLKAADPACGLPSAGGSYYSVLFEGDGTWVRLPDSYALIEKSRLPTPIEARLEVNRTAAPLFNPLQVAGGVVGVAAIPVFLVSIPFLGPDHWK
ncbi:hypothetical protein CQ393_11305 [Stenotrophomonas sp. MYb238]|uniref:hypothetical protein n=1 Tax=Stenotrophomonas sp. MYb238 TaxID=2040281 RepID=UPI001291436E|nr:hypothetical protein [Stenotrophomonas sp. MYb238]MQP76476.1 hypothetical protein [Stenotrophomonas sp. MYb238]